LENISVDISAEEKIYWVGGEEVRICQLQSSEIFPRPLSRTDATVIQGKPRKY